MQRAGRSDANVGGVSLAPVGFVIWSVGAALMVCSFTSLTWYRADSPPTFGDLVSWLPDPSANNAVLFEAYFGWLAWTFFAVLGVLCLVNLTRLRRRWVGVAALIVGVAAATVAAWALHAEGARAAAADSWSGLIRNARAGFWAAVAGSVIAGLGGLVATVDQPFPTTTEPSRIPAPPSE